MIGKQERKFSLMRGDIEDPLLFVGYVQSLHFKNQKDWFEDILFNLITFESIKRGKDIKHKQIPPKENPAALCVDHDKLIYILPMQYAIKEGSDFRFRFNLSKTDFAFSPIGMLYKIVYWSDFWTTESESWGHTFETPLLLGKKKFKDQNFYHALRLDGKKIFSKNGFIG